MRHWKTSEIKFLTKSYGMISCGQIANELNRSSASVSSYASKILKISKMNSPRINGWTEEEDRFILENSDQMCFMDMSMNLNRSYESVRYRFYKLGLKRKRKAA